MPVRLSGIVSGLDTEAIVKELMDAQSLKKTKVQNKITKLEWTQDKWKDLNKKIYALYTGALSKFKTEGSYSTKAASSTDETKLKVSANGNAPEGTHKVTVDKLASSQYLTGATVPKYTNDEGKLVDATTSTKLVDLGFDGEANAAIRVAVNGKTPHDIYIDDETTIGDFIAGLKEAGLNASFDTTYHRIFISSNGSGTDNAFSITTGSVEYTEERDDVFASAGYVNMTYSEKEEFDSLLNQYRDYAKSGKNDKLEEVADKLVKVAKDSLTRELETAAEKEWAELDDDEKAEYESLDDFKAQYLEENQDELDGMETDVRDSLDVYKEAIVSDDFTADSGNSALSALGLSNVDYTIDENGDISYSFDAGSGASLVEAADAQITYNGATFRNSANTFSVNGLNFTANMLTEPGEEITVTVSKDIDASYNMVKDFIKQYNEVLQEMNDAYSADSAKGYDPLTDEEREKMTEDQIEKWENKIKDSLLRRDTTLGSLISAMKMSLQKTVSVNGKNYSLSSFGITTSTDYKEEGLLHLYGDADDAYGNTFDDKLKTALANDPEAVMKTLTGVASELYATMQDKMKTSSISSALTFYNDKQLDKTMKTYKDELSTLEDRLADMEDKYYKQFTAMETAMANLQTQQNNLAAMLGQNG